MEYVWRDEMNKMRGTLERRKMMGKALTPVETEMLGGGLAGDERGV